MARDLVLLPAPRKLTRPGGDLDLAGISGEDRRIELGPGDRDCLLRAGRTAREALQLVSGEGYRLAAGGRGAVACTLAVDQGRASGQQGYVLSVRGDGIRLVGHDEAGLFYGAQTLLQIARQHRGSGRLPLLTVRDRPDLAHRGVQLDVSRRRIPTMESLKLLVDRLAHLKVNQLQLYTEHTFAYRNHPEAWGGYSPLTGEEILQLDQYCRERFVELVPNQNTFGHMERWLHRPRYEHLAENMPGMPIQYYLSPSDPGSLQLVEELLDELLPHFSSRQAMVGLDEVRLGPGGRSAALCEERGGPEQVYLDYLKEVHRIVRRHGSTMMYFADMVVQQGLVSQVPGDAIGLIWGYEEEYPFREHSARYAEAGLPFYTVPGTCCHASIGGRTGLAMRNIAAAVSSALEFGGSGTLVANWGDGGHWQPLAVTMAGYAYGAGAMWGLDRNRDADVAAALDAHLYQDEAQVTGRVSVDLGRACEQLPVLADWAAYQTILQQKPGGHEQLGRIEPGALEVAGEFIARTLEPLGRAAMGCPDAGTVADELRVAAGLMRHACHLAQARFQAVGTRLPDLPEGWRISHILPENRTAAGRAAERCYYWPDRPGDEEIPTCGSGRLRPLADEMEQLLADYRRTWLARNRPGGLDESAARFDRLLQLYRRGMQGVGRGGC